MTPKDPRPGFAYYLIFPLDIWKPLTPARLRKQQQAWPVLIGVLPLLVLASGLMLRLGPYTWLFYYGLQSLLLASVTMFLLQLHDLGEILDLWLNFWLSLLLLSLLMGIPVAIVSPLWGGHI